MLMAVEMWVKRDHKAEWNQWLAWLDHVTKRVTAMPGVTTTVAQPEGLSNHTPTLNVQWDRDKVGLAGAESCPPALRGRAARGDVARGRHGEGQRLTGLSINPVHDGAGRREDRGRPRSSRCSRARPRRRPKPAAAAPAADLTGQWDVHIEYAASKSTHPLYLRQQGNGIEGSHQGDFVSRDLSGTIDGATVRLRAPTSESHGDALNFTFTGTVEGDALAGTLEMGEYLGAKWTATRHTAQGREAMARCPRDAARSRRSLSARVLGGAAEPEVRPAASGRACHRRQERHERRPRRRHRRRQVAAVAAKIDPAQAFKVIDVVGPLRHARASSTSTPTSTPAPARRARTPATTACTPTASRCASA